MAHSLLSQSLSEQISVDQLNTEYESMTLGEGKRPTMVEVITTMEDWPAKERNDIGWAYVAVGNDYFNEAVTVIVSDENGYLRISGIEWGRPQSVLVEWLQCRPRADLCITTPPDYTPA